MWQRGGAGRRLAIVHRIRTVLIVLLVLNGVAAWAEVLGTYTLGERAWQSLHGRVLPQPIETHLLQLEIVRTFHGLLWLATATVFVLWIGRVYASLTALGVRPSMMSRGAAVAAFVVPLVNLVVPIRVVRDLWRASVPDDRALPLTAGSPLVPCWWGLVVLSAVLDPFWARLSGVGEVALTGRAMLLVVAQLTEIAAAVLGVVVVYAIDLRPIEDASR